MRSPNVTDDHDAERTERDEHVEPGWEKVSRPEGTILPGEMERVEAEMVEALRKVGFNPSDLVADIEPMPGVLVLERPPMPKEIYTSGTIVIPEEYLDRLKFQAEPNVGKVIAAGKGCKIREGRYVVFDVQHTAESDRLPQGIGTRFANRTGRICTILESDVRATLPEAKPE